FVAEHRISGDILCMLDQETLKGVGVSTVGQRLAILKAVYNLKIQYNIPIDSESYVPPSEAQEKAQDLTVERLHSMLSDQGRATVQLSSPLLTCPQHTASVPSKKKTKFLIQLFNLS
ncbi:hypothetical protein MPER_16305, partial [Moniliophthora perniciosa FA553]